MELSQSMRELLPMQSLLEEVAIRMSLKVAGMSIKLTVFEENNEALKMSQAVCILPCTKHIAIKYHFFCSKVGPKSGITLTKIDTLV